MLINRNSTASLEKQVSQLLFNPLHHGRREEEHSPPHLLLITAMNSGIAVQQQKDWVKKKTTKTISLAFWFIIRAKKK